LIYQVSHRWRRRPHHHFSLVSMYEDSNTYPISAVNFSSMHVSPSCISLRISTGTPHASEPFPRRKPATVKRNTTITITIPPIQLLLCRRLSFDSRSTSSALGRWRFHNFGIISRKKGFASKNLVLALKV
jgi:hypothetical protein